MASHIPKDIGRQGEVDLTFFATCGSWLTDKKGETEQAEQIAMHLNYYQQESLQYNPPKPLSEIIKPRRTELVDDKNYEKLTFEENS